jgi:hypothetical protein
MPYLPLILRSENRSVEVMALLDTGAIDFNEQTRKDRSLKTISDEGYTHLAPGKYTTCVKVVDTFVSVEIEL